MSKNNSGKAWLAAVILSQEGKPVNGEPTKGEYVVAMKPGQNLHGDPNEVTAILEKEFAGCTFKWA